MLSLSGRFVLVLSRERPYPHVEGRDLQGKEPKRKKLTATSSKSYQEPSSLPLDTISLQISPGFGAMPRITAFLESGGLGLFYCQAGRQTTKKKVH